VRSTRLCEPAQAVEVTEEFVGSVDEVNDDFGSSQEFFAAPSKGAAWMFRMGLFVGGSPISPLKMQRLAASVASFACRGGTTPQKLFEETFRCHEIACKIIKKRHIYNRGHFRRHHTHLVCRPDLYALGGMMRSLLHQLRQATDILPSTKQIVQRLPEIRSRKPSTAFTFKI
jgi:hypothetical protein